MRGSAALIVALSWLVMHACVQPPSPETIHNGEVIHNETIYQNGSRTRFNILSNLSNLSNLSDLSDLSGPSHQDQNHAIQDGMAKVGVWLCPKSNCSDVITKAISSSSNVQCALYSLSDPAVILALESGNASLVVDGDVAQKKFIGIKDTVQGPPKHTMHNKFCVLDHSRVITGSYNPTGRQHKDLVVEIRSPTVASGFSDEFLELHAGTFGGGTTAAPTSVHTANGTLEVLFCPDDPCEERVAAEIGRARQRILMEAYAFTSRPVMGALKSAHERGVEVGGMIEESQDKEQIANVMESQGVHLSLYEGPGLLHRKLFIIDGKVIIAGSANPTFSGYHENDENLLIIRDQSLALWLEDQLLRESCSSLDHVVFSKELLEAVKFRC